MNIEIGLVKPVEMNHSIQSTIEDFSNKLGIPKKKITRFTNRLIALEGALSKVDLNTWKCHLPYQTPGWHYDEKPKKMATLPNEVQIEIKKAALYFDYWYLRNDRVSSAILGVRRGTKGEETYLVARWSTSMLPTLNQIRDKLRQEMWRREIKNPRFFCQWSKSGIGIGLYTVVFWTIWIGVFLLGVRMYSVANVGNTGGTIVLSILVGIFYFCFGTAIQKVVNRYPTFKHLAEACDTR